MAKNIQAIRGMNDCSPTESPLWQWIEGQVRQILHRQNTCTFRYDIRYKVKISYAFSTV